MATPIPTDDYPLLQSAGDSEQHSGVERTVMDDGTPHVWIKSTTKYQTIPLSFAPVDGTDSGTLNDFLFDNAGVELSVTINGIDYVGYLWSNPSYEKDQGYWWYSVDFYCKEA